MSKGKLTNSYHDKMDKFLGRVLDAYKDGKIEKDTAVRGLAHVMAALDNGEIGEAVSWFQQEGVSYFEASNLR